jgi:regulator of RNase E activity RraB
MTMPHLMNCSHIDDGWCVECVKSIGEELITHAEIIENQRKQIETLYKAIEILKRGWGGHLHWDPTGRNGAGCDLCKMWWDARDEVDELLKEIEK